MHSLLATCADMKIKCSDGSIVLANKFTMLAACSVLNQVYEDTCPTDNIIPLTGIPSTWPRIAVDLLHHLKKPSDLNLQEIVDAQDAFQFVGCKLMRHALANRLWVFLKQFTTQSSLVPYIDRVMSVGPEMRNQFVSKFRTLDPRWVSVREVIRKSDLTLESATYFMTIFVRYYPASVVFREIFEHLPSALLTPQIAMMLMSAHAGGTYFHPGEIEPATSCVMRCVQSSVGHEYTFLRTVLDTMCDYEDAPVRKIGGTSIQYEYTPRISAHVNVVKKAGVGWTTRIAPWLTLTKEGNSLHGTLDLWKIPAAREAIHCQVHIAAVAERRDPETQKFETVVVDVWRRYDGISDHALDLGEYNPSNSGEVELAALLPLHGLRHIHINAFFGLRDAMHTAL
jgi:hypothetical protein